MIAEVLNGTSDAVPVWVAWILYVVFLLGALLVPIAVIVGASISALDIVRRFWRR